MPMRWKAQSSVSGAARGRQPVSDLMMMLLGLPSQCGEGAATRLNHPAMSSEEVGILFGIQTVALQTLLKASLSAFWT